MTDDVVAAARGERAGEDGDDIDKLRRDFDAGAQGGLELLEGDLEVAGPPTLVEGFELGFEPGAGSADAAGGAGRVGEGVAGAEGGELVDGGADVVGGDRGH